MTVCQKTVCQKTVCQKAVCQKGIMPKSSMPKGDMPNDSMPKGDYAKKQYAKWLHAKRHYAKRLYAKWLYAILLPSHIFYQVSALDKSMVSQLFNFSVFYRGIFFFFKDLTLLLFKHFVHKLLRTNFVIAFNWTWGLKSLKTRVGLYSCTPLVRCKKKSGTNFSNMR